METRESKPRQLRIEVPVQIPSPEICSACTTKLTEEVDRIPGVGSVEVDPRTSLLVATITSDDISGDEIVREIERIGFEVAESIGHASWRVGGLDCPDCARTVDVSVSRIGSVLAADLNFASGVLQVEYDSERDPRGEIESLLESMGYSSESLGDEAGRPIAEFEIDGLDCADCAESLKASIESLQGVDRVKLDFATARMRVGFDRAVTGPQELGTALARAGYSGRLIESGPGADASAAKTSLSRKHEVATALSGTLIVFGWLFGFLGAPELLTVAAFVAAIVSGGTLVARRALASLRARILDMNVLMSIAVLGAMGIGEWLEGAMVVFLFAIGGLLESRSLSRTRSSIRDLMDLAPQVVRLIGEAGDEQAASPADVSPGQIIRVVPGERIALDGRVMSGSSAVDESAITGESVPTEKAPGSDVFAGTLNKGGVLEVEVTALASNTTLARVIHLVEEAQAQQAPFQRLVDRFTRYYTPIVVVLAVAIALVPPAIGAATGIAVGGFQEWFYRALVLLVVSCPCALVISTPVAVVSAITRATKDGVLVKGGAFLELAPKIKVVAFDKTGTLTAGSPQVADVIALNGSDAKAVLSLAAAVEQHSTHPLAQAIVRSAEAVDPGITSDVQETPGRGVRATTQDGTVLVGSSLFLAESGVDTGIASAEVGRLEEDGRTVLVVALDDEILGVIGISDQVRASSEEVVASLRRAGVEHTVMLTGDNERTASAIASQTGVDDFRARLLPQEKLAAVSALQAEYGAVAMVGDGINDAPALAAADIGIAMGAGGSDTALETADVALISDDLSGIPRFLDLGRRTVANIWQNVIFSIAIKLLVLVAAALGVATLWMAVFADTGVALLVILNGLRLLRAPRSAGVS